MPVRDKGLSKFHEFAFAPHGFVNRLAGQSLPDLQGTD